MHLLQANAIGYPKKRNPHGYPIVGIKQDEYREILCQAMIAAGVVPTDTKFWQLSTEYDFFFGGRIVTIWPQDATKNGVPIDPEKRAACDSSQPPRASDSP